MATELRFEAQAPNTRITARNRDRSRFTSWGVLGGRAGSQSRFLLNPGTDHEENLGNTDILKIGPGDVVHIGSGGAGGWGDPLERDPEAVLTDVNRQMVSPESAERDYGVVIAGGSVNPAATEARRATLRAERPTDGRFFHFGPERIAYEAVWTDGNYTALTELLAGLPVHWRFFVKHRIFEAIDALPAERRRGDGSEVRSSYEQVVRRYPQLSALL